MTSGRGARVGAFLLSFSAAFLLLSLLFLFLMTTVRPSAPATLLESASRPEEEYIPDAADALTVLIFGTQASDSVAGTYLLARFDPVRGEVSVAAFPPSTLMGAETLEEAYRYGGARYTRNSLASYLGIPVDRYARIDFSGFVAAAAAVGTVEFDLSEDVVIQDGELTVTLHAGRQLLDGRKAAGLIQSRSGGALERCGLINELACAVIDQRADIACSVLADKVFEAVINLVDTDISYSDYERRKAPAVRMAEASGSIAASVPLDGSFDEGGRLILHDTSLAALSRRFL